MKKIFLFAFAAALTLAGCSKLNDLQDQVDDLGARVTTLEEQVKYLNEKQVPGLQATVAAIQAGVMVTSVTPAAEGGYAIVFSNGTQAFISNGVDGKNGTNGTNGKDGAKGDKGDVPVISAKEFEGEFYWTADGEFMLDAQGNKIPVHAALPQFRINQGKWQVTYDGGQTWETVETMGQSETSGTTISIDDAEDSVTFWIGETPYVIKKETSFFMVFDQRTDIGVPTGATIRIPYTLSGVMENDETEVDIFNVLGDWDALVIPVDNKSGYVTAKNNSGTDGKVFVYATNGRGKTDIKSLCFEEGVLSAVASVETIPAEGGEFVVKVTTNMDYNLMADNGGTEWITIKSDPDTKAPHVETITFVVAPNTSVAARMSTISVVHPVTEESVLDVVVVQAGTAGVETKYEDYLGEYLLGANKVTVTEKVKGESYNINGLVSWDASYGASTVEAKFDPVTSNMVIMEQSLGDYQNSSYGTCVNFLTGMFKYGSKTYPHYYAPDGNSTIPVALFIGNISKDGDIVFDFGTDLFTGGKFVGWAVRWIIQEGSNAGLGNYRLQDLTGDPVVLSKPRPASDAYKAWLGEWVVPTSSASFTITVAQDEANATYLIKGWASYANGIMKADFDAKTGNMLLYADSTREIGSGNVTSSGVSYASKFYYVGYAQYDESSVISITGTYIAAECSLNEDGSALISGKTISTTSKDYEINNIRRYWIGTDEGGTQKKGSLSGYSQNFPLTITRPAGGSSVKESLNSNEAVCDQIEMNEAEITETAFATPRI